MLKEEYTKKNNTPKQNGDFDVLDRYESKDVDTELGFTSTSL